MPQLPISVKDVTDSIERFLRSWKIVRICPHQIDNDQDALSLNILTLAISLVIFLAARSTIAGSDDSIPANLAASIISILIMFAAGYATLIVCPKEDGLVLGRKWNLFLVHTWLASMIVLILTDGLLAWNQKQPLTSIILDWVFGAGSLLPLVKDGTRALMFSTIAIFLVIVKSKCIDPTFRVFSTCSIATILVGLAANTAILLMFVYGNVI